MNVTSALVDLLSLSSADDAVVEEEKFGDGGFLSFRRRARVRRGDGEWRRVFVKLSDSSRGELGHLRRLSDAVGRNECGFYGRMLPLLPAVSCAPACLGQRASAAGCVLIMEDLEAEGFEPASERSSLEQVESALECMARLQATFWRNRDACVAAAGVERLGDWPFVSVVADDCGLDVAAMTDPSFRYFADNFRRHLRRPEDADVIADGLRRLRQKRDSELAGSSRRQRPLGLNHGDLWPANLMFRSRSGSLECRIFDWQFWNVGAFGNDLGQLLVSGLRPQELATHVDRLCAKFCSIFQETLLAVAAESPPFTQSEAESQLLHSFSFGFFWAVVASTSLWKSNSVDVGDILENLAHLLRTRLANEM